MEIRKLVDDLVNEIYQIIETKELSSYTQQELVDLGDSLQSGAVDINYALFADNKEVREVVRAAFSNANLIQIQILK